MSATGGNSRQWQWGWVGRSSGRQKQWEAAAAGEGREVAGLGQQQMPEAEISAISANFKHLQKGISSKKKKKEYCLH